MTTVSIGLAVALFLLVHASLKWGFVIAMRWAGAMLFCIPVFWFVGLIVTGTLGSFGVHAPPLRAWLVVGSVIALIAWQIAKRTGWAKVLGGMFVGAIGFSGIVLVLFLFFGLCMILHLGVDGLIVSSIFAAILWLVASSYRRVR